RVYYDNVVGEPAAGGDNVLFHQTAHYHFDVHFVGGNLVIPVASDPEGGIRFYSVEINVVGLKITSAGPNTLMRPQVFAEVVEAPKYIVSGVAQNVNQAKQTFDIKTPGGTIVSAAYGDTDWIYIDNTVDPANRSSKVGDWLGAIGLNDNAVVDVIGTFSSDNVLLATEVDITFPDVKDGVVDNTWRLDNTFVLRLATDNVVFPKPSRGAAYYDNLANPAQQLNDSYIDNNAVVRVRGYNLSGVGINAYWISIGP
ncbi:MAG: hypothetical protein ACM3OG_10645, partial [Actinomycetota bacterium]